jgi:hypothetical protein
MKDNNVNVIDEIAFMLWDMHHVKANIFGKWKIIHKRDGYGLVSYKLFALHEQEGIDCRMTLIKLEEPRRKLEWTIIEIDIEVKIKDVKPNWREK